jgi:hypothetical protein
LFFVFAISTIQGQSGDPIQVSGYWSSVKVREGDTWKIRMNAIIHPPPPGGDRHRDTISNDYPEQQLSILI